MRRALAALLMAGCTSTSPSPTDSTPTKEPEAEIEPADDGKQADPPAPKPTPSDPPPDVDPARWKCDKDEDCAQTCALGAVNAEWIAANPNEDTCDDGCGWKHGMEACRDGECVTLDKDGNIDAGCTKQTKPIY